MIDIGKICKGGNRTPANTLRSDVYRIKNIEGLSVSAGLKGLDLTNRTETIMFDIGEQLLVSFLFVKYGSRESGDYYAYIDDSLINSDSISFTDINGTAISVTEYDKQESRSVVTIDNRDFIINSKIISYSFPSGIPDNLIFVENIYDTASGAATFSSSEALYVMQNDNGKKGIVPPYLNQESRSNALFIKTQQDKDLNHQALFCKTTSNDITKIKSYIDRNPFCYTRLYPLMLYFVDSNNATDSIDSVVNAEIKTHNITNYGSNYLHKVTFNILEDADFQIIFNSSKIYPSNALIKLPNFESRYKDSTNYTNRSRMGKLDSISDDYSYTNFHINLINHMAISNFYTYNFFSIMTDNGTITKSIFSDNVRMKPVNFSTLFKNKSLDSLYFNCDFGR